MSPATLMLIVKSLWPFLKEILLKDKGLRDLIAENVVATFLCGCLLFLFALFLYTANLADTNFNTVNSLNQQIADKDKLLTENKATLESQAAELAELKKVRDPPTPVASTVQEPSSQQHTPESHTPQPDRPPTTPTRPSVKPKGSKGSLKSYVESRLMLEQDGK